MKTANASALLRLGGIGIAVTRDVERQPIRNAYAVFEHSEKNARGFARSAKTEWRDTVAGR